MRLLQLLINAAGNEQLVKSIDINSVDLKLCGVDLNGFEPVSIEFDLSL